MTLTHTVLNKSTEPWVAVHINPLPSVLAVTTPRKGALGNVSHGIQRASIVEDSRFPMKIQYTIRQANIWHVDQPREQGVRGKTWDVAAHTFVKTEDSVSNETVHTPLRINVSISQGGNVLLNADETLDLLLSLVHELCGTITAGDGDASTLNALGTGSVEHFK